MKILSTNILALLFASLISCVPSAEKNQAAEPTTFPDRPNILWISCEDMSPRLGCYGDPVAQTPNIDKLATEGARYTHVFTSAPVCAPCRSGIITGMYQTAIGTHHMRTSHGRNPREMPAPYSTVPPHYVKAFPEYLRAAGYYCTNNVKTDYQFAAFGEEPVTIWDESSNKAHYRNRKDKNQPFFAVFNYTMTHESQQWSEPKKTDPATVVVPPYYPDTEPVRKSIAKMYDNIAILDSVVGVRLRELEEDGLAENTVVFFWSDHGDGFPRGKRWLYESGTRVPMVIRWPGFVQPGSIVDDLISSVDWGPTVLSMAKVEKPVHVQGKAFLGVNREESREYVYGATDRFDEAYDMARSVRNKQFLYIRNFNLNTPYVTWLPYRAQSPIMQELLRLHAEDGLNDVQKLWFQNTKPAEELYDCEMDPHNLNNLAKDPAYHDVLARLRSVLDAWRTETKDKGDIDEALLKEQGWPNGVQPITSRPHFVPNAPENRHLTATDKGGVFTSPTLISLYSATQGASIAYTLDSAETPKWHLYVGPIRLNPGITTIRSQAIRYGFKHSEIVEATFEVK